MKKIVIAIIFVLVFISEVYGGNSPSEEAEKLFANGDYLAGMNILTTAINDPDPVRQALALQTYAKFYENLVGNTDYALTLYENILRTNLSSDHPLKVSVQKEIDRLKLLKAQYGSENVLLRRMRSAEIRNLEQCEWWIGQLGAIINKKPQYYRLAEVYYYLGRNYLAVGNFHEAYMMLKKAVELKPAVNFYLPVNVYKDMAYAEWVRKVINSVLYSTAAVLLIITIIVFYSSFPWRWLKFRHIIAGLILVLLWLIVLATAMLLLSSEHVISAEMIAKINAAPPCFVAYWTDNPQQQILKHLFFFGFIGISAVFIFSAGTSRFKCRWMTLLTNAIFALLVFTTLIGIFYMQNCDRKSVFTSQSQTGLGGYLRGSSYFVNFNIEPYVLTNPKAYPDLAIDNITDVHLREWIQKYCPFSSPVKQPSR